MVCHIESKFLPNCAEENIKFLWSGPPGDLLIREHLLMQEDFIIWEVVKVQPVGSGSGFPTDR